MARDLTFFLWADTHFGYDQSFGEDDLRGEIIEQMRELPGWPYPPPVGGVVGRPEFVALCGDAVDGASGAGERELAFFRYFTKRMPYPHVEVMGNHDGDPAYVGSFRERYGALSHSFDNQGVHFICLNSLYDPDGIAHFGPEELTFLERDLASIGSSVAVILLVHSRLDRASNGAEVLALLKKHHILLIAGAHLHKPSVFQVEGIDCIDVGQCRDHPIDPAHGRSFTVVHVTHSRLTAIPWRWDLKDWEKGQRWENQEEAARRFTLAKAW